MHIDENRKVIVKFGGFSALIACLYDVEEEISGRLKNSIVSAPATLKREVKSNETSSSLSQAFTTSSEIAKIVSLKRTASKIHKKGKHYAIKRLAIESIANLLLEPENHKPFLDLNGISLLGHLIESNSVLYHEQKRICAALFYLSKNEEMRVPLYENDFIGILRFMIRNGDQDTIFCGLKTLRNLAQPIHNSIDQNGTSGNKSSFNESFHSTTDSEDHCKIDWSVDDIKLISSLVAMQGDLKSFKVALDIIRIIGFGERYLPEFLKFGGAQLIGKFFEAACDIGVGREVRSSALHCIQSISSADNAADTQRRIVKTPEILKLDSLVLQAEEESLQSETARPGTALAKTYAAQEKLRISTRCILDLSRGCQAAHNWMEKPTFIVALLQILRGRDIVSIRCSAQILAELVSSHTVKYIVPYVDYVVDVILNMEPDKLAQFCILKVLERMCHEEKRALTACSKYTVELVLLCEKLLKHTLSDVKSQVALSEKKSIIRFALILSLNADSQKEIRQILPKLKNIQNLLQVADPEIRQSTITFIHNVYNYDDAKSIVLMTDCIWSLKLYARMRRGTEVGEKAKTIVDKNILNVAALTIQRYYRRYRAEKYMNSMGFKRRIGFGPGTKAKVEALRRFSVLSV